MEQYRSPHFIQVYFEKAPHAEQKCLAGTLLGGALAELYASNPAKSPGRANCKKKEQGFMR